MEKANTLAMWSERNAYYKRPLSLRSSVREREPLIYNDSSSDAAAGAAVSSPATHALIHVQRDTWSGRERVGLTWVLLNNSAVLPGGGFTA